MSDNKKLTEEQVRLIAVYATSIIRNFVNDINAAAYPHPPQVVGGYAYQFFNAHLDTLEQLMNGIAPKEILKKRKEQLGELTDDATKSD